MCVKVDYPSEQTAANAVWLHLASFPECPGIHAYPCGDHHHVGHVRRGGGALCQRRHADYDRGVPRERATLHP